MKPGDKIYVRGRGDTEFRIHSIGIDGRTVTFSSGSPGAMVFERSSEDVILTSKIPKPAPPTVIQDPEGDSYRRKRDQNLASVFRIPRNEFYPDSPVEEDKAVVEDNKVVAAPTWEIQRATSGREVLVRNKNAPPFDLSKLPFKEHDFISFLRPSGRREFVKVVCVALSPTNVVLSTSKRFDYLRDGTNYLVIVTYMVKGSMKNCFGCSIVVSPDGKILNGMDSFMLSTEDEFKAGVR